MSEDYQGASINNIDFAALKNDTAKLTAKQEQDLHLQVKTIFAHNCNKCHGPEKVKGELRLDRKDMIFKGGESGPVILAGNPRESELFRRITLPRSDKEAMPSKGKKLSDNEIAVIGYWIQKGAPWPDASKESSFRVAKLEPIDGVSFSEGLESIGKVMDKGTLIRSYVAADMGFILHTRHQITALKNHRRRACC